MRGVGRLALLVASALLLTGASSPFAPKGATFGPDYAELVFELGVTDTVSLGSATNQEYSISQTADWATARLVKLFGWAAKKPKAVLLPAGKQVHVVAQMDRLSGAPGVASWANNKCLNVSAFTPQPSTRYRVRQTGSPFGACYLAIIDVATGREPQDVKKIVFPPAASSR